jgi:hypothetical protein
MKLPYDICLHALIQVIYQRDKIYYFNNKNVISITTIVQGKTIDWANILFKQLQRELTRWTTAQTKVMMGIIKVDPKKDVCHSTLVIEILIQHLFLDII